MIFEIFTLLSYWYHRFLHGRLLYVKVLVLVGAGLGAVYGAKYLLLDTPFPVYVLDKLNLRQFSLPNLMCHGCNNFSYPYLIENRNACGGQDVFLLTFVTSAHTNVEARNVMRRTWAGLREYRGYKLRTVFMFGTHDDRNLNHQTDYEQKLHGDIVQGDFHDSYYTLTNKSSWALGWATTHCPQARYILKTDDDSFNAPQRIVDYLIHVKDESFFGGYCFTVIPDRRVGSKFHVSETQYPDQYYPTYCAGPGYVLSQQAARDVVSVAPDVRYLPMEDVFVTGICRVVAGRQYTQISGMVISRDQMTSCALATWAKNSHNVVPGIARQLWLRLVAADSQTDCVQRNATLYFVILTFVLFWGKHLHNLFRMR